MGYGTYKIENIERPAYSSCRELESQSPCNANLTSSQGGVPSWKFSNFTPVYLFWFMYKLDNAAFDDMKCTWKAGHVICFIS